MFRYKIVLLLLCFYKSFSQEYNSISYERQYLNNNEVALFTNDVFDLEFNLQKNIKLFSNYTNTNVNLLNSLSYLDETEIQNLQSLDIGISKEFSLKNNWKTNLTFNPQVRNNVFEDINLKSFIFNSKAIFKKKLKNSGTLNFGVEYGTLFGKPSFYPIFLYNKSVNNKYSFGLGFPKSFFKYFINQKNSIQINSEYNTYFTRINNSISRIINQDEIKYSYFFLSKIDTALEYNYIFYNNSIVNIMIGKSFGNNLKIEESNNEVENHKFNNNFIITMGFKYNLNFK